MKFTQDDLKVMSRNTLEEMYLILQEKYIKLSNAVTNKEAGNSFGWETTEKTGWFDTSKNIWYRYPYSNELVVLRDLGDQIARIKKMREWTNCSLKAGKEVVEILFPNGPIFKKD